MSERITRARFFNFWSLLPTRFRPAIGVIGEALARRYLRKAGYSILAANWSCPEGEIDIVATRGSTLIFVEVKSRSEFTVERFSPTEAVDDDKEGRIKKAGDCFMWRNQRQLKRRRIHHVRFDVLAVRLGKRTAAMEHLKEAF